MICSDFFYLRSFYHVVGVCLYGVVCFFFQAEDGIRDLVRSRGLGDVYKRQGLRGDGASGRGAHEETGRENAWLPGLYRRLRLSLIHI